MTTTDVLRRLKGVRRTGDGWTARCPAHDDNRASLSVTEGDRGTVLHCHAGCDAEAVVGAAGLSMSDLFFDPPTRSNGRPEIVAEYDYRDEDGAVLFQVVRFAPKDFRQRRPDGFGGWDWKLGDTRRVLYHLPELVEAVALDKTVHVVEGEKDVHAIEAAGGVATCNAGGAGKWRPEYSEVLAGARVRIVADRDEPGEKHARDVAGALDGIATSVEIVRAREGKDASDHLAAGFGLDDFVPLDSTDDDDAPAFLTLADLLANPELLQPPECVLPRIAYRGRLVILAGPDKSGKSTLLGHGIAAVSGWEHFLGSPLMLRHRRAILLGLEEALGDAVRRLADLRAAPDRVQLVVLPDRDLLQRTDQLLEDWPADLLVIDSLQELARVTLGTVPDDGDNAGWAAVVRPLVALARRREIAVVLLHHVRRSDGQFRGAGEIAAAADALLEMSMPKSDDSPYLRRIAGRGRWTIEPFGVELVDGRYQLSGGAALSLDARVLLHVEQNRGVSKRALREAIGGRATSVDAAINSLLSRGAIVDRGAGNGSAFYPPEQSLWGSE